MSTPFTENIRHGEVSSGPWCLLGVLQGLSGGGGGGDSTKAHRGIYIKCQWDGQVQAAGWANCSRAAFWRKTALQWPDRGEESQEQKSIHSFNTDWVLDVGEVPSSAPDIQWSPEKPTCPCPWWTVRSQVFSFIGQRNSGVSLPVPSSPNIYN